MKNDNLKPPISNKLTTFRIKNDVFEIMEENAKRYYNDLHFCRIKITPEAVLTFHCAILHGATEDDNRRATITSNVDLMLKGHDCKMSNILKIDRRIPQVKPCSANKLDIRFLKDSLVNGLYSYSYEQKLIYSCCIFEVFTKLWTVKSLSKYLEKYYLTFVKSDY